METAETTAANTEQEEQAFEAGFDATTIEPAAAPVEPTPETPAEPAASVAEEKHVETPKLITMDDLNAALDRQAQTHKAEMDKVYERMIGKTGDIIQKKIEVLKQNSPTTVSGISPKAKERLASEFPELAAMLFDEEEPAVVATPSSEVSPPVVAAPVFVPDDDNWQKDPTKVIERRLLTRDHKDWETIVRGGDFQYWKDNVLSAVDSIKLDTEWDADFVSEKLTEFKAYQSQAQTLAATNAKKAEEERLKKERLDNATTPTGLPRDVRFSGSHDAEEEAAMMESFGGR